MKRVIGIGASALAFTSVLALSGVVMAQEPAPATAPAAAPAPAPAPEPAPVQAQATYSTGGGGGMTLPGAAPAQAVAGDSDHDQVIGTLGVGYLGMNGMAVDNLTPAGFVPAPIIGVRYWVDQMIGIDAGLGIGIRSASASLAGADQPRPSDTAFLLHGGVPLNLASAGHFSFQVIPELNVGFGSRSVDAPAAGGTEQSGSGFHFDIGARAGAEIHFGFMGLPKLALQGSVGLKLQSDSVKHEDKPAGGATVTNKESALRFGTTLQDNPWNIFTGNVAALYYF